jgi:hypothetical protein
LAQYLTYGKNGELKIEQEGWETLEKEVEGRAKTLTAIEALASADAAFLKEEQRRELEKKAAFE